MTSYPSHFFLICIHFFFPSISCIHFSFHSIFHSIHFHAIHFFLVRAAGYATVYFEQNRYSDFELTAAFLCLLVAVFVLTDRPRKNFLLILSHPLFPIPNIKKFSVSNRKYTIYAGKNLFSYKQLVFLVFTTAMIARLMV